MQMVQRIIELGKTLLHCSRKKGFQLPSSQILLKQMPSTLQQRNTFLFKRLTIHHSTSTLFLNTYLKSSNRMINKRISDLSCNKEEFNKVRSVCETALKDSGHFSSISFNSSNTQNAWRNRNRKVLWLNPPYSQNVKTNIGKLLTKILRKPLPKNNKYHKVFSI